MDSRIDNTATETSTQDINAKDATMNIRLNLRLCKPIAGLALALVLMPAIAGAQPGPDGRGDPQPPCVAGARADEGKPGPCAAPQGSDALAQLMGEDGLLGALGSSGGKPARESVWTLLKDLGLTALGALAASMKRLLGRRSEAGQRQQPAHTEAHPNERTDELVRSQAELRAMLLRCLALDVAKEMRLSPEAEKTSSQPGLH